MRFFNSLQQLKNGDAIVVKEFKKINLWNNIEDIEVYKVIFSQIYRF